MTLTEAIKVLRRRAQCEREAVQTDQNLLEALDRVLYFVEIEAEVEQYALDY